MDAFGFTFHSDCDGKGGYGLSWSINGGIKSGLMVESGDKSHGTSEGNGGRESSWLMRGLVAIFVFGFHEEVVGGREVTV